MNFNSKPEKFLLPAILIFQIRFSAINARYYTTKLSPEI